MAKYVLRPVVYEAEQFTDPGKLPTGVLKSPNRSVGHYITLLNGTAESVQIGNWIIAEPGSPGCYFAVEGDDFLRLYQEAGVTADAGAV